MFPKSCSSQRLVPGHSRTILGTPSCKGLFGTPLCSKHCCVQIAATGCSQSHSTPALAPSASAAAQPPCQAGNRVYLVSDLHTDYAENMDWVEALGQRQGHQEDTLIVAGDVSDDLQVCPGPPTCQAGNGLSWGYARVHLQRASVWGIGFSGGAMGYRQVLQKGIQEECACASPHALLLASPLSSPLLHACPIFHHPFPYACPSSSCLPSLPSVPDHTAYPRRAKGRIRARLLRAGQPRAVVPRPQWAPDLAGQAGGGSGQLS